MPIDRILQSKTQNGKLDKKAKTYNLLSIRDSHYGKGHKYIGSGGMGKDISCKWTRQESWSCNTHIDFKIKAIKNDKKGNM